MPAINSPSPLQMGSGNATWRLIDPFSNVLFSNNFSTNIGTVTLTQPGTYTILIEGRFNAGSGTAAYTFTVVPQGNQPQVPFSGSPLTIGSVINGAISTSGEADPYVFTLGTTTRLHFDSLTDNGSLNWSLAGPAGTLVNSRPFNSSDSFDFGSPLMSLPAGTYLLTVAGSGRRNRLLQFPIAGCGSGRWRLHRALR
jgi:hypothetical protein